MSDGNIYEQGLERNTANFTPLSPLTFLGRTAAVYPDHASIIHGKKRFTWAETYARCRRLASALAKRGIGPGDTVAVMGANTPEMVEAAFGVPMSGGVLNTLNVRRDAVTITHCLNPGEAKVLITDTEFSGTVMEALAALGRDIAVIDIDGSAQNRIIQILGANDTCGPDEARAVTRSLIRASTVLLQLEVSLDLSMQVASDAASQGKRVVLDPGPVRPEPLREEFFQYCHVFTPNETEAQALLGFPVVDPDSAERAARWLVDRGVELAIIKLGAQGAYYATGGGGAYVPPFKVEAVDSVAAGDAFNGALAVALAEGQEIPQAVRTASAAGALAVTKTGAQDSMPTRAEVEALLREQPAV